tara:strand:- start:574 stop:843 length:270 start_codon:yes stop_codon:yes gene_type:complete
MSDEFSIDIDKALENAKTNDLAGVFVDHYPNGVESVKQAVNNCINLAGLDKKLMSNIADGKWSSYTSYTSNGTSSKKIMVEYDIKEEKK